MPRSSSRRRARGFALVATVSIAATLTPAAAAAPARAARPLALALGLAIFNAGGNDAVPYLTVTGVHNRGPRWAVAVDLGYSDLHDRLWGPRLSVGVGGRAYLAATVSLYARLAGLYYHEFDVHYPYSDASQWASTSLGGELGVGHELVTGRGLSWTVEADATLLSSVSERSGPSGASWRAGTAIGYRW